MEHSRGSHRNRVADLWGHYAGECLVVAIAAQIGARIYPLSAAAAFMITTAILVTVIGSFLLMRRHDRGLCETCMAEMPLNPEAEVERKKMRFWVSHTGSEMKYIAPYLGIVLLCNFAYEIIGFVPWAIVQSTLIYLILSQVTHRKLQPWCPWCKNGGDRSSDLPEVLPSDDRLNV